MMSLFCLKFNRLCFSIVVTCIVLFLPKILFSQHSFHSGFDKNEYLELLKISSQQYDTTYRPMGIGKPEKFKLLYRSKEIGFSNMWDLWISDDSCAVISIRGTIGTSKSWLSNLYSAMLPAEGSILLPNHKTETYYKLASDKKASVHSGWLFSMLILAEEIVPELTGISKLGYSNVYIFGHSQGGGIAFLLRSYLEYLKETNPILKNFNYKTYCSAAPKPGNLYYAYDYEWLTRDGSAYNIVNVADWVPEVPFSIQTTKDFNDINPFINIKSEFRELPFPYGMVLISYYNKIDKSSKKAAKKQLKVLGNKTASIMQRQIKGFEAPPTYFSSSNYSRAGNTIILKGDSAYYERFIFKPGHYFVHHSFSAYIYLLSIAYPNKN